MFVKENNHVEFNKRLHGNTQYVTLQSETTTFASISRLRSTETDDIYICKYTKMRLRLRLGRKRIFCVLRAQETCLVAANVVPSPEETNSAPQIP